MELPQHNNPSRSHPHSEALTTPLSLIPENSLSLTEISHPTESKQHTLFKGIKHFTQLQNQPQTQKSKPYICFIPLPYCEDPQSSFKPLPQIRKFKVQTSSFSFRPKPFPKELPPIEVPLGETPINEYLDYVLTQEINVQLRGAKILAEEVKRIKEEKKKEVKAKKKEPETDKKLFKRGKNKLIAHSFLFKLR